MYYNALPTVCVAVERGRIVTVARVTPHGTCRIAALSTCRGLILSGVTPVVPSLLERRRCKMHSKRMKPYTAVAIAMLSVTLLSSAYQYPDSPVRVLGATSAPPIKFWSGMSTNCLYAKDGQSIEVILDASECYNLFGTNIAFLWGYNAEGFISPEADNWTPSTSPYRTFSYIMSGDSNFRTEGRALCVVDPQYSDYRRWLVVYRSVSFAVVTPSALTRQACAALWSLDDSELSPENRVSDRHMKLLETPLLRASSLFQHRHPKRAALFIQRYEKRARRLLGKSDPAVTASIDETLRLAIAVSRQP
jgi:hypothetical protein